MSLSSQPTPFVRSTNQQKGPTAECNTILFSILIEPLQGTESRDYALRLFIHHIHI